MTPRRKCGIPATLASPPAPHPRHSADPGDPGQGLLCRGPHGKPAAGWGQEPGTSGSSGRGSTSPSGRLRGYIFTAAFGWQVHCHAPPPHTGGPQATGRGGGSQSPGPGPAACRKPARGRGGSVPPAVKASRAMSTGRKWGGGGHASCPPPRPSPSWPTTLRLAHLLLCFVFPPQRATVGGGASLADAGGPGWASGAHHSLSPSP